MILQACAHSQDDVPGSGIETQSTFSHDAIQTISIKAEEISDEEVEQDPSLISSPGIQTDNVVSCLVSSLADSRVSVGACFFLTGVAEAPLTDPSPRNS